MNFARIAFALIGLQLLSACGDIVRSGGGDAGVDTENPADAPTIVDVSPSRASQLGTTEIVITGTGFAEDSTVVLGSLRMTDVSVISDTELRFTAAASTSSEEPLALRVFTVDGTAVLDKALTYNKRPTIVTSLPRVSALGGGGTLTITGTGFQVNNEGTPVVRIGEVQADDVQVIDDETITAILPGLPLSALAVPQALTVDTANGSLTLPEAIILLRPGLLFGSQRVQQTPGIFYLDPPTQKVVRLVELVGNVSKIFEKSSGGIGVRFGNRGPQPFGSIAIGSLDISRGLVTPEATTQVDGNPAQVGGATLVDGEVLVTDRSGSGNLGQLDLASGIITILATNIGASRSACIIAGAPGQVFVLGDMDQPIRVVNLGTGVTTNGPTLIGDVLPGDARCHGVAVFDGSPHFIQFDRTTQKTVLSQVNPLTGQVNEVAPMPDGSSGLLATPNFLLLPPS